MTDGTAAAVVGGDPARRSVDEHRAEKLVFALDACREQSAAAVGGRRREVFDGRRRRNGRQAPARRDEQRGEDDAPVRHGRALRAGRPRRKRCPISAGTKTTTESLRRYRHARASTTTTTTVTRERFVARRFGYSFTRFPGGGNTHTHTNRTATPAVDTALAIAGDRRRRVRLLPVTTTTIPRRRRRRDVVCRYRPPYTDPKDDDARRSRDDAARPTTTVRHVFGRRRFVASWIRSSSGPGTRRFTCVTSNAMFFCYRFIFPHTNDHVTCVVPLCTHSPLQSVPFIVHSGRTDLSPLRVEAGHTRGFTIVSFVPITVPVDRSSTLRRVYLKQRSRTCLETI